MNCSFAAEAMPSNVDLRGQCAPSRALLCLCRYATCVPRGAEQQSVRLCRLVARFRRIALRCGQIWSRPRLVSGQVSRTDFEIETLGSTQKSLLNLRQPTINVEIAQRSPG